MKWILFFTSIVIYSSCTYDNKEEYYGNVCDTLNISFAQTIKPIIDINCVSCHNNLSNNGGVSLEDYENIKEYADNGLLLGVVEHKPGFKPMPGNGEKLDDCTIQKIRKWIEENAQNN